MSSTAPKRGFAPILSHIPNPSRLKPPPSLRPTHINNLPDELLRQIFLLLVQQEFHYPSRDAAAYYPWVLATVCSRWRCTCIQYPKLWSYVSWKGHQCAGLVWHCYVSPVLRIYRQLERSKNSPLEIDATDVCDCDCKVSGFRAVLGLSERWKTLVYDGQASPRGIMDWLLRAYPSDRKFTLLEDIAWSCDFGVYDVDGLALLRDWIGSEVPNLQSATLTKVDWKERGNVLPWGQLTTLNLDNCFRNVDTSLDLLSECDSLAHFRLLDCDGRLEEDGIHSARSASDVVVLGSLLSLDIDIDSDLDMTSFLSHLQTPNLQNFSYRTLLYRDSINAFAAFLSFTSLTKLTLQYSYDDEYGLEYMTIFDLTQLQHLSLFWVYVTFEPHYGNCDGFLERMVREESQHLLPRLRYLELRRLGFDPVLLTRFVASRVGPGPDRSPDEYQKPINNPETTFLSLKVIPKLYTDEDQLHAQYCRTVLDASLASYIRNGTLKLRFSGTD